MLSINSSRLYLLNFDLRRVEKVMFYNFLYITELERKMSIATASANILEQRVEVIQPDYQHLSKFFYWGEEFHEYLRNRFRFAYPKKYDLYRSSLVKAEALTRRGNVELQ